MLRKLALIAVPLVAALAVAGVLALRPPAPLEPLAVETLAATAPGESWVTQTSEGTVCPAFSPPGPRSQARPAASS